MKYHNCRELEKMFNIQILYQYWDKGYWILQRGSIGDVVPYSSYKIEYCPFCGEKLTLSKNKK